MLKKRINQSLSSTEFYVFVILIVISIVIHLRSGLFFTNNNIVDIARSMVVPAIYALCAFLAFLSTGPDVSFPMIAALSSYLAIRISNAIGIKSAWYITFLIAAVMGALMGCLNGFLIVRFKLPSLIVTLGTSSIFSGILLGAFEAGRMPLSADLQVFSNRALLTVKNAKTGLGSTLPMTFLIMLGLYLIVYLVLYKTLLGRGIYAIGGDEVAAQRAGYNVNWIRFGIFVVTGALAAIGGTSYAVMALRYTPTEFAGSEMIIIAAIVLGGTRMTGGVGTLTGCILGTILLTIVQNSLILLGISTYWQRVVIGLIIVVGTAVSAWQSQSAKFKGIDFEEAKNE